MSSKFDLLSPIRSDFSFRDDVLTSTLLSHHKSPENSAANDNENNMSVRSQIVKIESMISDFVLNVQRELKMLKQLVSEPSSAETTKKDSTGQRKEDAMPKSKKFFQLACIHRDCFHIIKKNCSKIKGNCHF